jgi:glutamine synthetase
MRQILPAVSRYSADLAARVLTKKNLGFSCKAESELLSKVSEGIDNLYERCQSLREHLKQIPKDSISAANYCAEVVVPAMDAVRSEADALELLTDKTYWPFPTYSDLLFY